MGYLNGLLILAAEEGAEVSEPTGLDLVLPAAEELIWASLAFAIVAFLLMKVAFPKIRAAVEAREAEITGNLQQAEASKTEAQSQLDEYKKQLAEARSEANKIVEEARQSAEQVRKDVIAKAEAEAQQIVARASDQIEAERNRTMDELRGEVATLAVQLAEKVVLGEIDASRRKQLVDNYISEVSAMNGGSSN
ncbi:MAG: F0F1 ATP synthase subunit B [Actinomycetota bacterium]